MTKSPIAYIVFNRPRHTRESFAAIRAQQPTQLFIIADGPRVGHPADRENCKAVREIVSAIDWPCEVHRLFAEQNMGCKLRVSSGLNWVFDQVESAIILEDDCVPHPDFFYFCDELLNRYLNDPRVGVITGNNFQAGKKRGNASYYFSKYNHCWGWATWQRAWKNYRVDIPDWPEWKNSAEWLQKMPDPIERKVWADILDRVWRGEIDTWDYQWTACVWHQNMLTATPNVNLVTNIGFGPDATHTVTESDQAGMTVKPLGTLTHPPSVKQNIAADRFVFDHNFGGLAHPDRFYNRLKRRQERLFRAPAWLFKKIKNILGINTSPR